MRTRRRLSLLLFVVVCTLLLGVLATPVGAHAFLGDSDPANGEQLEAVPDEITLSFTGDGVVIAEVTIAGPSGENVAGEPVIDPDDTQVVSVPLEADDGDGMYIVEWEVLADDGHTTSGTFFFSVGEEPLDRDAVVDILDDSEAEELSTVEAGAKGLLLLGIIGLFGIPVTARIAVHPVVNRLSGSAHNHGTRIVDRRVFHLLFLSAVSTLLAATALGLARGFHEVLDQQLGQIWLLQIGLALGITILLGMWRMGSLSRTNGWYGAFVGSLLLIGTIGWTSHSATAIGRVQGTVVDIGHIAGAGLWVGGLVVLALVMPALLSGLNRAQQSRIANGIILRYSLLALSGVTLAAATGLILAAWHVETIDGLLDTLYGVAVSTKTVLVLIALGLGGGTRYLLLRYLGGPDSQGFHLAGGYDRGDPQPDGGHDQDLAATGTIVWVRRAIRFELGILLLVILLSGVLTSVATPAVITAEEVDSTTIERTFNDEVVAEVTILPVVSGEGQQNIVVAEAEPLVFEVAFLEERNRLESTEPVRLLALDSDGTEIEIELEEFEEGPYSTVQPLPDRGIWELRITGAPDGMFGSVWFDVTVVPDLGESGHEHGAAEGPFVSAMWLGALGIGLIGSLAVLVEAIRFRNNGPDR